MSSTFAASVRLACESALVARRFKRLRSNEIALPLSADFLGWVGLNLGKYGEAVRVNPFVGVHCIPVMRMISQLRRERYSKGSIATFAVHLWEIHDPGQNMEFTQNSSVESQANGLADFVVSYGVEYMKSISNLDALLPLLKSRVRNLGGFPERYAVALFLSGAHEQAIQFVTEQLANYSSREPIVQQDFSRFAKPFLARME